MIISSANSTRQLYQISTVNETDFSLAEHQLSLIFVKHLLTFFIYLVLIIKSPCIMTYSIKAEPSDVI